MSPTSSIFATALTGFFSGSIKTITGLPNHGAMVGYHKECICGVRCQSPDRVLVCLCTGHIHPQTFVRLRTLPFDVVAELVDNVQCFVCTIEFIVREPVRE